MKFSKYHALQPIEKFPFRSRQKGLNDACQPLKIPPPLEGGAWGGEKSLNECHSR